MRLQQARRTNPYPWSWEIPMAAMFAVLLVMTIAAHAGRTLANVDAGAGWQFTERSELFTSMPGLIVGDATAGLANPPAVSATSYELWVWMTLTALVVLVAIGLALRSAIRRWGPGRIHGMASPEDAGRLLGRGRLRRDAAIIRPDLHGKGPR